MRMCHVHTTAILADACRLYIAEHALTSHSAHFSNSGQGMQLKPTIAGWAQGPVELRVTARASASSALGPRADHPAPAARRASLPSRAHERAGVNALRLLGALVDRLALRPGALAALLPPLLLPLLHVLCPPKCAGRVSGQAASALLACRPDAPVRMSCGDSAGEPHCRQVEIAVQTVPDPAAGRAAVAGRQGGHPRAAQAAPVGHARPIRAALLRLVKLHTGVRQGGRKPVAGGQGGGVRAADGTAGPCGRGRRAGAPAAGARGQRAGAAARPAAARLRAAGGGQVGKPTLHPDQVGSGRHSLVGGLASPHS